MRPDLAAAIKWLGVGTALLSLVLGSRQVIQAATEFRARRAAVAELLFADSLELVGGNFAAAARLVDSAATVDRRSPRVRRAREGLTMEWLRQETVGGMRDLGVDAALADRLAPVLSTGAAAARGSYKADLLAHLAWADFVRHHQRASPAIEAGFHRALAADSTNVYAHAMLGYYAVIAREPPDVPAGRRQFAQAMASGREAEFVRRLQLAAYRPLHTAAVAAELLRTVVTTPGLSEDAQLALVRPVYTNFFDRFRPDAKDAATRDTVLAALPPDTHLRFYRARYARELADTTDEDSLEPWRKTFDLAQLEEHVGHRTDALARYRLVAARLLKLQLPQSMRSEYQQQIDAAIQRLSEPAASR